MIDSALPSASDEPTAGFMKTVVPSKGLLYPNEPHRFSGRDVVDLLVWSTRQGASDISIQSDEEVFLEIYGKMHRVTRRKLSNSEVLEMATSLYESETAKKELSDQRALDFAFTARPSRDETYRFRINATSLTFDGQRGVQITARTIPTMPPTIDEVKLEQELRPFIAPKQGLIVVTGSTGSGKSTLLAAIIRHLCEDPDGHRKILTYEAPIEYVYDLVDKPTTLVSQHEIGSHLPNFTEAVRNALRRKPNIILVGEARDAETIGETITASLTGHLVYSTVHASGFSETIRRMVNAFPKEEKNARAVDIISSMRMSISQRLVPSTDGKRVALREYVIFNEDIVDELLDKPIDDLTVTCRSVLKKYGHSFLQDAHEKFTAGLISQEIYNEERSRSRAEDRDVLAVAKDLEKRSHEISKDAHSGFGAWASDLELPSS